MMNRRAFISRVLGAVASGAVLDVDKLLWVPGETTIFLPPAIVHSNTFLSCDIIMREALAVVDRSLRATSFANAECARPFFVGPPILNIRKPRRYA